MAYGSTAAQRRYGEKSSSMAAAYVSINEGEVSKQRSAAASAWASS